MTFNLDNLKVTESQKALSAYIKRETGKVVKPESIALVETMRQEFRKDPERVAEREAVAAAARAKQEAALEKYLAKANQLAAKLGHPVVLDVSEENEADDDFEEEPVAEVTPIKQTAKSRAAAKGITAVPPVEDDFDESDSPVTLPPAETEDTDAIQVVEADDQWESDGSADEDEDF